MTGVHPLATGWAMNVGGISRKENVAVSKLL
jgi:hypothetical protein